MTLKGRCGIFLPREHLVFTGTKKLKEGGLDIRDTKHSESNPLDKRLSCPVIQYTLKISDVGKQTTMK